MNGLRDRLRKALEGLKARFAGFRAWRVTPQGMKLMAVVPMFVLAFGLVAAVGSIQATSTPDFCATCHIMKPYHATWAESKHKDVACVECHISPGVGAELRKKIEALNMVVKYVTVAWGPNPWAEVDDAACLRCHERRLLEGRAGYKAAQFDHRPHLAETEEGLRLRCTSCHQNRTKDEHFAVDASTCGLCHMRPAETSAERTACRTCHEPPEGLVRTAAGEKFDHRWVSRQGLDCKLCHARVTRGTGEVPPERCLTCHNDPEPLAKVGDTEELHRAHTTAAKVSCNNCHLEIQHGRTEPGAAPHEPRGACATCHGSGHNAQQDVYAGIGARGVPDMPGPMYVTGVTCSGCHNRDVTVAARGAMFAAHTPLAQPANAVSCMLCHGPGYDRVLNAWKAGLDPRVDAMTAQMEATASAFAGRRSQAWDDAAHNMTLLVDGRGIHNVNYAYAVLDKTHELMNRARASAGLPALPKPWRDVAAGSKTCIQCHTGIEKQTLPWRGRQFSHGTHLESAGLECGKCHRPHNQRPENERVSFGEDGCLSCHHEKVPSAAKDCLPCHGSPGEARVSSVIGTFSHTAHRKGGLDCAECHTMRNGDPRPERSACRSCHEQI